jgi:hypothetical protein
MENSGAEINDQLQQEPWVGFGWSVEDLLADPEQKPTRTMTIWAATCCNWLRPSGMPMPETFRARTKLVEK